VTRYFRIIISDHHVPPREPGELLPRKPAYAF
jgi:hypothetical protein